MNPREKQILALRTAVIAGIFSMIVCSILLLNFWQLKTSDPLESEALKSLVERLQEDTSNEDLKIEIRNLDLMVRNAFFTNQWQIRAGAYLLFAGIIVMVMALRIYYSLRSNIAEPDSSQMKLDIEMLISRKWILYTSIGIFMLAIISAFLSIDHLTNTYPQVAEQDEKTTIPTQEIMSSDEKKPQVTETEVRPEIESENITDAEEITIVETVETDPQLELADEGVTNTVDKDKAATPPDRNEIVKHFPAFRGPFGLGITERKDLPVDWDGASDKNVVWKTTIELPGYNSPVIWDDKLFISGANESIQSVFCYNRNTGVLLWRHDIKDIERPAGTVSKPTEDTGYAASTLTTDGRFVCVIYASGDIVGISMDGQRVWGRNLGIPDNHYGHSSSLILWKDLLFVQFDTNKAGKVLALDAKTGTTIWETNRKSKISWASPILADMGNHLELILSSSPEVAAYNPETGKELWSLECLTGEVGPSPGYWNGIVYAANEYANLVAIKPGATPEILWETNEYLPEVASPVVIDGMVFIGTSYGVIACFDANTGEILWEFECDQGIYASPVIGDGKVYFLDMDGKMHIFGLDKTQKLLGEPDLGEKSVCTPAFADGKIYLRGYDNLYCIGK